MEGYDEATYGDRFASVYDDWYDGITDADACAAAVVGLARAAGAPVLELGVGTGRLAVPIAGHGVEVVGLDSSRAMLDRCEAKAEAAGVRDLVSTVVGDMAEPVAGGPFGVVLVAYNTLFNLVAPGAQARCLAASASVLAPGGSVVVEAFVPDADQVVDAVAPRSIAADRVVLSVSRSDPRTQEALGQYVDITEDGIRLRPWHIRWATPAQLDEMAADAGLVLAERWQDWARTPFDDDAPGHVSRYVRVEDA